MSREYGPIRPGRPVGRNRRTLWALLAAALFLVVAAAAPVGAADAPRPPFVKGDVFKSVGQPSPFAGIVDSPTSLEELQQRLDALANRSTDEYRWTNAPLLYAGQSEPPTPEELAVIQDAPFVYPSMSPDALLQSWKEAVQARPALATDAGAWARFLAVRIKNWRTNARGGAFDLRSGMAAGLGEGWYVQVQVWVGRRYRVLDWFSPALWATLEVKANGEVQARQVKMDRGLRQSLGLWTGYVLGQPATPKTAELLGPTTTEAGAEAGFSTSVYPAKPIENNAPFGDSDEVEKEVKAAAAAGLSVATGTPATGSPCAEAAGGRWGRAPPVLAGFGWAGADQAIPCSGARSGLARALLEGAQGAPGQDLGGVDFSSLELRYVSDPPGAHDLQFAYSAANLDGRRPANPALGAAVLQASAADLRAWLALDPSTFWVNLSPDEPDRIIDAKMGRTNAGRAMLEADFALKRTGHRLVNPATALGAKYWDQMGRAGQGLICYTSRLWIVPGRVEVRQDGDALYVLKAPLDVKTESDHIDDPAVTCPETDPATLARQEDVDRKLLLPEIVKAVNQDPEYAPLRRAFVARVVAEWIRGRHAEGIRTAFDDVIGSGKLGAAELRDGWVPRTVYDEYVAAIRSKANRYTQRTQQGNQTVVRTFITGGVSFEAVKPAEIGAAAMQQAYPKLPGLVQAGLDRPVAGDDGTIWVGAQTAGENLGPVARLRDAAGRVTDGPAGTAVLVIVALVVISVGFRVAGRRRPGPA